MLQTTSEPALAIQIDEGGAALACLIGRCALLEGPRADLLAMLPPGATDLAAAHETLFVIDVEGHALALHMPSAADVVTLRRAVAAGVLSATVATTMSLTKGGSSTAATADYLDSAIVLTHDPVVIGAPAHMHAPRQASISITQAAAVALPAASAAPSAHDHLHSTSYTSAHELDVGPLPAPHYGDLLTPHHEYFEWDLTLLDPIYRLPADYSPDDLVGLRRAGIAGSGKVRAFVVDDLRAMASAAAEAGTPLAVASAFRSHDRQQALFASYVARDGFEEAAQGSARPGHSEHQLGTAIDFKSADGPAPWALDDWARTPAGAWIEENAWRFGFIMSYPEDHTHVTGYMYEPWHYRYIGRPAAARIHDSELTTREWLWSQGAGVPDSPATRSAALLGSP